MASQIDRVSAALRQRILSGHLKAGERVLEVQFAAELGVSRTPLRLALEELERQGLLERLPKRGFRVRGFTIDAVSMAMEVRGVLEGMAARKVAESGAPAATVRELQECVWQGRELIDKARRDAAPVDTDGWAAMNARFHGALVAAAGNSALTSALEHIGRTPMVWPGALWVSGHNATLELDFVERAQHDHDDIVRAIEAKEGARADFLMREHARRSAENKRALAAALQVDAAAITLTRAVPSL